jgi:hypothetical protein
VQSLLADEYPNSAMAFLDGFLQPLEVVQTRPPEVVDQLGCG